MIRVIRSIWALFALSCIVITLFSSRIIGVDDILYEYGLLYDFYAVYSFYFSFLVFVVTPLLVVFEVRVTFLRSYSVVSQVFVVVVLIPALVMMMSACRLEPMLYLGLLSSNDGMLTVDGMQSLYILFVVGLVLLALLGIQYVNAEPLFRKFIVYVPMFFLIVFLLLGITLSDCMFGE